MAMGVHLESLRKYDQRLGLVLFAESAEAEGADDARKDDQRMDDKLLCHYMGRAAVFAGVGMYLVKLVQTWSVNGIDENTGIIEPEEDAEDNAKFRIVFSLHLAGPETADLADEALTHYEFGYGPDLRFLPDATFTCMGDEVPYEIVDRSEFLIPLSQCFFILTAL